MKILLYFSILIFTLLTCRISKIKNKTTLLILLSVLLTPVLLSSTLNQETLILFSFLLLLIFFFDFTKKNIVKKGVFVITSLYLFITILYLNGIISNGNIDYERLFYIDNHSLSIIKTFQTTALYVPIKLRFLIFNQTHIIFALLKRITSAIWVSNFISYYSFTFIYLLFLSLKKRKNLHLLFYIFIVMLSGILPRNPNNYLLYLFSLPIFILFFIKNVRSINIKIFIISLISGYLFYLV